MRPSHVVMAVGVSGTPNIPEFDGKDAFKGRILHSSQHGNDVDVAGKNVLVVGSGTSAHDIAQDAYLRGADVTMLQRSSATVVSIEQSGLAYSAFRKNEGVRPIDETDLMVASVPYDLLRRLHGPLSRKMAEADRELLRGLEDAGFKLDNGEDDTGFFLKLVRYLGGYYIDVGASQLIIDGKIKLKSNVGVDRLVDRGVVFSDGELLETDVIVLGTGYRPLQHAVGKMFGPDIAERVGPIWGLGKDNELRNMWVRTTQPGLYIAGGTFTMCRFYSKVTALLIKAELEQLIE
jgi:putative flavoprotein involved in K+ transport